MPFQSNPLKLADIAQKLGASMDGPAAAAGTLITGVSGLKEAGPSELSFLTNQKFVRAVPATRAAAVICAEDFAGLPKPGTVALRCKDPHLAYAQAVELFFQPPVYPPGIHPAASVDPTARIGKNAHLGPYAVVGPHVTIGDDCILLAHAVVYEGAQIGNHFFAHSHAVVRENCRIGDHVVLQNGVVIGSDGFGFAKDKERDRWQKVPQAGIVVLQDDVEVQANSCIDRASLGETNIGRGVRIDNLVQVGHNNTVGENTLLCSQVGMAGSNVIGKNVVLAGQVGVADHSVVEDGAVVTAQSGIHGTVEKGKIVSGSPAFDNKMWLRCVAVFQKLPELARAVRAMKSENEKE